MPRQRKPRTGRVASAVVRRAHAPDVLRFAAQWEALIGAQYRAAVQRIMPAVVRLLSRLRRDAISFDELLKELPEGGPSEGFLKRLFTQIDTEGESALRQRLPGVAIPDVLRGGPRLEQAWVKQNVGLIDVPRRIKNILQREITGPLDAGVRVEDLAARLEEQFGFDARRAELIARDQTLKLSGQLQEERQTQAGIKRYVWTTSGDERVRHDHAELDGKVFSWDDPPVTNASEVARGRPERRGHPGSDFQCRCSSDPVIDDTADFAPLEVESDPAPAFSLRSEVNPGFSFAQPVPRAPAPEAAVERAAQALGDIVRGPQAALAEARIEATRVVAGRSLEALQALPIDAGDRKTIEGLKANAHFRGTGNVTDVFGSSPNGLPTFVLQADGSVVLRNGRHRLTAARELGLDTITARIIKQGPRGGVKWEFIGPTKVGTLAPEAAVVPRVVPLVEAPIHFEEPREFLREFERISEEQVRKIDPQNDPWNRSPEYRAITRYALSDFAPIRALQQGATIEHLVENPVLFGSLTREHALEMQAMLAPLARAQAAMAIDNPTQHGPLFRGLNVSKQVLADLLSGTSIEFKAASNSASYNFDTAKEFAAAGPGEGHVVLRFKELDRGTPMGFRGNLNSSEMEVVVGDGEYRIVGKTFDKEKGLHMIDLERVARTGPKADARTDAAGYVAPKWVAKFASDGSDITVR